jgi:hypothetical protein
MLAPAAGVATLLWSSRSPALSFQSRFSGTLLSLCLALSLGTLQPRGIGILGSFPEFFGFLVSFWFAFSLKIPDATRRTKTRAQNLRAQSGAASRSDGSDGG